MDVYGMFWICTAPSTSTFMNLCWLLISWQAGCCKQLIFYASMRCNREVYDVVDWWPSRREQGGLEGSRLGRNGWLLCGTWFLCQMLYVSTVNFENTSGLLLINLQVSSEHSRLSFQGWPPRRGIKQSKFSDPFATFCHVILVLCGFL